MTSPSRPFARSAAYFEVLTNSSELGADGRIVCREAGETTEGDGSVRAKPER
jgi:hypothetical protein